VKPSVNKILAFLKRQPRWRLIAAAVVLVVLFLVAIRSSRRSSDVQVATFTARRGPLNITVLEGGGIQALESQEIKCEIRASNTKIVKIVDEGYLVTEEDIKNNKVLVELDTGDLERQIVQQDISYENARAALVEAQEAYAIQMGESLSNIKFAEQKARFARLDFDKFLGTNVTQQVIGKLGIEDELAATQTNIEALTTAILASVSEESLGKLTEDDASKSAVVTNAPRLEIPPSSAPSPMASPLVPLASVDFKPFADIELLGDGEAKQRLRRFAADLKVAEMELNQAQKNTEATKRLYDKGFVTKVELAKDELSHENSQLKVMTAQTARDLYIRFDFTRAAEDCLSKYVEAVRDVVSARRAAISKQAQYQARLRSAQGRFNIENRNRRDLYRQLEKCVITAKRPGLVIYGSGRDEGFRFGQEPIYEGATVRDRQTIITIPDMTKMAVRVKIHESYIKKIQKGQKARITLDAYPDKAINGEVSKVSVLPDSGNRYLSPDLKLYPTMVEINETHEWLKPGMTAKVEILVTNLSNVVYVPIQAVSPWEDRHVCYIADGGSKPERRVVDIGENNDEFIEIRSGLKEGERVLLRPLAKTDEPTVENGSNPQAGTEAVAKPKPKADTKPQKKQRRKE